VRAIGACRPLRVAVMVVRRHGLEAFRIVWRRRRTAVIVMWM